MKRRRGFTLLELLLVIALIGVLVGTAAPAFSRLAERGRVARLALAVGRLYTEAGLVASRSGRDVIVSFDPEARTLRLATAHDTPERYGALEPVPGPRAVLTFPAGVGVSGAAKSLRVHPDRTSAGAQLTLSAGQEHATVVLDAVTGRVR